MKKFCLRGRSWGVCSAIGGFFKIFVLFGNIEFTLYCRYGGVSYASPVRRLESTHAYLALLAHHLWSVSARLPEFERRPHLSLSHRAALIGEFRQRAASTTVRVHHRRCHCHPRRRNRRTCADHRVTNCGAWLSHGPRRQRALPLRRRQ